MIGSRGSRLPSWLEQAQMGATYILWSYVQRAAAVLAVPCQLSLQWLLAAAWASPGITFWAAFVLTEMLMAASRVSTCSTSQHRPCRFVQSFRRLRLRPSIFHVIMTTEAIS